MSAWQGQFDMSLIETAPGAAGPFAPPADWQGTADSYRALLRQRFAACPAARQQIGAVARRLGKVYFTGPWAEQAQTIAPAVSEWGASA